MSLLTLRRHNRYNGMTRTVSEKYKTNKGITKLVPNWVYSTPDHAINPILIKFGMWGGLLMCSLNLSFKTIGSHIFELWGLKFPLPIDKTSIIQQLFASVQAVAKKFVIFTQLPRRPTLTGRTCTKFDIGVVSRTVSRT